MTGQCWRQDLIKNKGLCPKPNQQHTENTEQQHAAMVIMTCTEGDEFVTHGLVIS